MRNPFARRKPQPAPDVEQPPPEIAPVAKAETVVEARPAAVEPPKVSQRTGVDQAAEMLIASGATRALFVSPEGDDGAAASVMVAREVADSGLRVLLVDLTISGAASGTMLDTASRPGITNLLASEASFTEAVHVDLYSDCAVLPVGTADPARAMKAADRLPVIIRSLTSAYDLVVVECGATDAEGLRPLIADGTEILVSAIDAEDETAAIAEDLRNLGHGRVTIVSPRPSEVPELSSSASAAASAT